MKISLKNYILRHLIIAFLIIMAIWAALFYAYMLEEVYDNVDDGLKSQKIEIIKEVYQNPSLLKDNIYGVNQFRILPADVEFNEENILSKEYYYMPYDDEREPYRVLKTGFYYIDGVPYTLEIRTSTLEEDDLLIDFAVALVVLYFVLVLSVFFINKIVIRRVWKPFNIILDNLKHYEFGNKQDLRPLNTNVIEFNRLNKGLQQMWKRNEKVFDEQKMFIENASHELQTPLAIVINKLELLLDNPNLSQENLEQLAGIKIDLTRIVSLNKALLMLSRIENKQYKEVEKINFTNLAQNMADEFIELLDYKGLKLIFDVKNDFIFEMNKDLAIMLISNLLRNAMKYNIPDGFIEIQTDTVYFKIRNTGKNVSLNKNLIFQRFYKDTQNSSSTGLGLAIVDSIVNTYPNLSIEYVFEDEKHCFLLKKINH